MNDLLPAPAIVIEDGMTTAQIINKLRELTSFAGKMLFRRIELAKMVLCDDEFIQRHHKGSYDACCEYLARTCFPEIELSFGFRSLLHVYVTFPAEEDWQKVGYNIRALWIKAQPPKAETESPAVAVDSPSGPAARHEPLSFAGDNSGHEARVPKIPSPATLTDEQKAWAKRTRDKLADSRQEVKDLKEQIKRLEGDVGRLTEELIQAKKEIKALRERNRL